MSTTSRLLADFGLVEDQLAALIQEVPVRYADWKGGTVVVIAPNYWFAELSPDQQRRQLGIKRDYERWIERVRLLLAGAPDDVKRRLDEGDREWRTWLELGHNWSVEPEPERNVAAVREAGAKLRQFLSIFGQDSGEVIVVADTNSLLASPEPTTYREAVGADRFKFLLLPTVLRELDELKVLHRNPDVRDKAAKVVTRIKGWRKQGSLLQGVTVAQTITVAAVAEEPSVKSMLSWLDPENRDDRIVAAVLEVQVRHPTARVLLVTGDINLQNKADAAAIETVEPPAA